MVKRLRILLIAAGFLAVSYLLVAAEVKEGEVFYLSFNPGNGQLNPGIPGDGITISSLPFSRFIVEPRFNFTGVTNGITCSAFFRDTVPLVDVTNIRLDLGLTGRPPVPCGFILGVGSPSPPVLTPPVNGVQGIAISFTQEELDALLVPLRQTPECADLSVDDFSSGTSFSLKARALAQCLIWMHSLSVLV
jgi:hypothetical protein